MGLRKLYENMLRICGFLVIFEYNKNGCKTFLFYVMDDKNSKIES